MGRSCMEFACTDLHFTAYLTAASLNCAITEFSMGSFHAVTGGVLEHGADLLFSFFFFFSVFC